MLHAERVDGLMLDLPGDDRVAIRVPRCDPGEELLRRPEQPSLPARGDQGALGQWAAQVVVGHEELGVAEVLDRADAEDDLLAGLLGSVEHPVELAGLEPAGAGSSRSQ